METQVTEGEVNFNHAQWSLIEKMSTRIPSTELQYEARIHT